MELIENIPVWGTPDDGAVKQIAHCRKDATYVALMADHHLGYAVPIGGVVVYEGKVSPSGVGFDIACGNKAVLLDVPAADVRANVKTIMDDVWRMTRRFFYRVAAAVMLLAGLTAAGCKGTQSGPSNGLGRIL